MGNIVFFFLQVKVGVSNGLCEHLRACRAVRLFLRARAVINFLMRAASTLEIKKGEQ